MSRAERWSVFEMSVALRRTTRSLWVDKVRFWFEDVTDKRRGEYEAARTFGSNQCCSFFSNQLFQFLYPKTDKKEMCENYPDELDRLKGADPESILIRYASRQLRCGPDPILLHMELLKDQAVGAATELVLCINSSPNNVAIFTDGSFDRERGGSGAAVCPALDLALTSALGIDPFFSNHESGGWATLFFDGLHFYRQQRNRKLKANVNKLAMEIKRQINPQLRKNADKIKIKFNWNNPCSLLKQPKAHSLVADFTLLPFLCFPSSLFFSLCFVSSLILG
ncbi:uncharacterized protein VP01_2527g3 [Puccinia sorghi]|uniref:Uncharacterized protein n=1 Tax=Puccinia sorghi TaxID=27349 RepID=A0A0L6V794_9BASI|nr:uncharacterized protein VP01_2527g3 [Puccinia sorghi]